MMASSKASLKPERVASIMLSWHDLELISCTNLQTLWAGYGHICAIEARALTDDASKRLHKLYAFHPEPMATYPLILKVITSPSHSINAQNEGHSRKLYSYEVEQFFYSEIAPALPDDVAVARCVATTRDMKGRKGEEELEGVTATIMTDLRSEFPVSGEKRAVLSEKQVWAAIDWLGKFHRHSWNDLTGKGFSTNDYVLPPLEEIHRRAKDPERKGKSKLWLNGGYTYLATRGTEYAGLEEDVDSEWSSIFCSPRIGELSIAEAAAKCLTPQGRWMETYIHGDVKSENLFTTNDGTRAAFFDFQYIGLGFGLCDLAKLFTCSVPLDMLVDQPRSSLPHKLRMSKGEERLLLTYRTTLLDGPFKPPYERLEFDRHWETALVDWCRFQASWGFWGNTEWLQARVRSICDDAQWRDWLKRDLEGNRRGIYTYENTRVDL